jgi:aminomethyltransferase
MKTTPFTDIHIALGAKMHEFAGYNMPIEYSGINDEHMTVRTGVGVFDVSHMGEIWIKGPKALDLLQRVCSNDASKLALGQAQYTYFPNGKGGIVDDIIVYYFEPEKYMLVVNASNIEKDWNWLQQNNTVGAELENASDHTAQLAVQGPKATELLQKLTSVNLSEIPFYHFKVGDFAGVKNVILSNTGYTGSGGFELYFYPEEGVKIWNALFEAGEEYGIKPIGLGARDTLRLEKGYCLYGNDIDDTTSPIEAGLGWITKFSEGRNFIDRDILEKQKTEGVSKKLIRFELIERGIPRHGYEIVNADDEIIGTVTSGTMLPDSRKGIGMGYVKTEYTKPDSTIFIKIRTKNLEAKIIK